ncbi:hypothetical protein H8B09_30065 [Paenibacillus sp. PR3]|uniref:56B-like ribbon-helix-helix domain-containing protein n=1 Tax=Paenibacillus terricola TaxID=2763503 RepID=A0ABR8N522_9BACL|nr:hypothetical protein [Paenibacillus terricola]MBD3922975.1 hypothetical protein [Paenibacillus terricola]
MSNKKEALSELLNKKPVNTKIQESVDTVIDKGTTTSATTAAKKKATYELDMDLHTELKVFAAKQDKRMVDIVELAIRRYLEDNR